MELYCCVHSVETLMKGVDMSETCSSLINLRNSASRWLLLYEYITMHGPLNVECQIIF